MSAATSVVVAMQIVQARAIHLRIRHLVVLLVE
jgi:hypothetical protein